MHQVHAAASFEFVDQPDRQADIGVPQFVRLSDSQAGTIDNDVRSHTVDHLADGTGSASE